MTNILSIIKRQIYYIIRILVLRSFPETSIIRIKKLIDNTDNIVNNTSDIEINVILGNNTKIYTPSHIYNTEIGDYTYIAKNSHISLSKIGKFCSIGPNVICGWGIHPLHGISTHPMFFSTLKQNGMTLSDINKVEERQPITIGNDVFIGANVTILDGVTIGNGAVIGAGAVVSKDIPPYAVAVGCPIRIIKYRFSEEIIKKLEDIKWWDFDDKSLKDVEQNEFDIETFLKKNNSC